MLKLLCTVCLVTVAQAVPETMPKANMNGHVSRRLCCAYSAPNRT
jgi:hypothetical protein